jgi:hypothetical protein
MRRYGLLTSCLLALVGACNIQPQPIPPLTHEDTAENDRGDQGAPSTGGGTGAPAAEEGDGGRGTDGGVDAGPDGSDGGSDGGST